MTIVTYVRRPKRARKRKAQAADMPVIVRAGKKAPVAATNGDSQRSSPRRTRGAAGSASARCPT